MNLKAFDIKFSTIFQRHSGATRASIGVRRVRGLISVEITDNGRGVSREKLLQIQAGGHGVGLRGIRERLRQFHGEMGSDSEKFGTNIIATIPVPEAESVGDPMPSAEATAV